jgi:8-oxo-dGTP pyrophosphatase MutT (NUDIX family)
VSSQQESPVAGAGLPVIEEVSAGGLVVDAINGVAQAAVIARRNRGGRLEWCLPKGHLEPGESPAEAAVREIREETGIDSKVVRLLGTIDYWFIGEGSRIHKIVHHYLLSGEGGQLTAENDPDAEAEQVAWVPLDELRDRLAYPNERRLAQLVRQLLDGTG